MEKLKIFPAKIIKTEKLTLSIKIIANSKILIKKERYKNDFSF
jgi:hypothetical protein